MEIMLILLIVFIIRFGAGLDYVFLHETQDNDFSENFDCIYYVTPVETIPYCQRPDLKTSRPASAHYFCENYGMTWSYTDLIEQDIKPSQVLRWSSSVEAADDYSHIYYNRSQRCDDCFVCQCTKFGSFGRFCQYQLTHDVKSFEQALNAQFDQKRMNLWGVEDYGSIICYTTLECNYGLLCLDWRDICDGRQQCMHGLDEENCDLLEFNECEEDEYRCENGMCIAEEYWLDGISNPYDVTGSNDIRSTDCMDQTDEKFIVNSMFHCPYYPHNFECDEYRTYGPYWSCGDGEYIKWQDRFVFRTDNPDRDICYNFRNAYYMCELWRPPSDSWPSFTMWTTPSGMCNTDSVYNDLSLGPYDDMPDGEKCTYLIRCALSDGKESKCPCNQRSCSEILKSVCDEKLLYQYPRNSLIAPYLLMFYNWTRRHDWIDSAPDEWHFNGSVQCRGFEASSTKRFRIENETLLLKTRQFDYLPCLISNDLIKRNYTSLHRLHEFCWANESLTFNNRSYGFYDICTSHGRECISQYRIKDKIQDCSSGEDESSSVIHKDFCWSLRGQRFRCSPKQSSCINALRLGTQTALCHNRFDENFYGTGVPSNTVFCLSYEDANCQVFKDYLVNSWKMNATSVTQGKPTTVGTSPRLQFRSYCNSGWDLPQHWDESSVFCQHWICLPDQFRCRTGQCIDLEWVCDGEWDCSDASDEEAIVLFETWVEHNKNLEPVLSERKEECMTRYSKRPFSNLCNITAQQFPCYPVNMTNITSFLESNQCSCIHLTQIGDGKQDCYMGFDEKNTLPDNQGNMLGFQLLCKNDTYVPFASACLDESDCVNDVLCSYRSRNKTFCSGEKDALCHNKTCVPGGRCNDVDDCLPYGEDEYWCAPKPTEVYRSRKAGKSPRFVKWFLFPAEQSAAIKTNLSSVSPATRQSNVFYWYSYICNRGVAVIGISNDFICLCPPAYYGEKCQFFSDRITVIVRMDRKTLPITLIDTVLMIQATLLFNDEVMDHHEFYSDPSFDYMIKQQFYLLYSRSNSTLLHKKARYRNRSDIIVHHPYSIRFYVYSLPRNQSTAEELGAWHYSVYFDFLPAYRLATVLKFPFWFQVRNPCQGVKCPPNAVCKPFFNSKSDKPNTVHYYCSCQSGFYGKNCEHDDPKCHTYCSSNSICRSEKRGRLANTLNPFCVCPLGYFGARCHLRDEACDRNPCLNNGTCHITHDPSGEQSLSCSCSKLFYGYRCERERMSIRVDIVNLTVTDSVAVVAQFYDVHNETLELQFIHQQVYKGLPSAVLYNHDQKLHPILGVLKIYDRQLAFPVYYILYIQYGVAKINVTSSPAQCPPVSSILHQNDVGNMSSVPDIFKYHHLCRNDTRLFCFYDEEFLCICQDDHIRVDCFGHATRRGIDHCDFCLSGGKCVKGSVNEPNDFFCLCPDCHQGLRCQFSLEAFGITLDYLLLADSTGIQTMYIALAFVLFLVGLLNNLCAFLTFKRKKPRKMGVGNYLLIVAILNICALFWLLVEFIHIRLGPVGLTNDVSCKLVNYLLSVFPRSTYWLTTWITLNRLGLTVSPASTTLKNPRIAILISIGTILLLFALHGHELLVYRALKDVDSSASRCVSDFSQEALSMYNRASTLSHFFIPFMVQLTCISVLIILIARSRAKTVEKNVTFRRILERQFRTQKELYVTPVIIVLSALPQGILSLSLACSLLSNWQRHIILIGYLLSYTPQVLGFILYVLPSSEYKKEFLATTFAKVFFSWMFKQPAGK